MDGYESQDREDRGVCIVNSYWTKPIGSVENVREDPTGIVVTGTIYDSQWITAKEFWEAIGYGSWRPELEPINWSAEIEEFHFNPGAWQQLNNTFLDDFDWQRTAYPGRVERSQTPASTDD